MDSRLIPLSVLALDLPELSAGWGTFLADRDIAVVADDVGRAAVDRNDARALLAERREQLEAADRRRAEADQRAVEQDQRFRARLHPGIPAGQVPEGLSPAMAMMAADPIDQGSRRESVLEHALARRGDADALARGDGAIIYHPIRDES